GLAIAFGPPRQGTVNKLPRLRFGRSYQLRARAVDLAGNSLGVEEDAPSAVVSKQLTYRRFEPVVAPTIALHQALTDGESVAMIVIRSRNSDWTLDSVATTDLNDRHIAPTLCSQLLAEAHGMFDAISIQDAYTMVVSREGTYADPVEKAEGKPTSGAVVHTEKLLPLLYLPDPLELAAAFVGLRRIGPHAVLALTLASV